MSRVRFQQYAWGLLTYNLVVILGGAFVRASKSGDGCGAHWPKCDGVLFPSMDAQLKTFIEYGHRLSSGLLLPLILLLVCWAFRAFPRGHAARKGALSALALTLVEALIGAGLVLFGLVAHDRSVYRAVVMPTHLVTTFLLLMALTLTAWWGGGAPAPRWRGQGSMAWALGGGLVATCLLGVSGAITALGDTLFPAGSLREGLQQDFSPSAHFLVGLRLYHPMIAMTVGLYLTLLAGYAMNRRQSPQVERFGRLLTTLFLVQMGAGLLNLTLLAPIWMQLIHLLAADLLWISLVLLTVSALAAPSRESQVASREPTTGAPGSPPWTAGRALEAGRLGGTAVAVTAPRGADSLGTQPLIRETQRASWRDYLALTKPRVISLLLFTTVAAMWIAAGGEPGTGPGFWVYVAVAVGFYMAAGAANAINMVLERDLDLAMGRTAQRPTVTETIPPRSALLFALALMVGSVALLWGAANLLSALLAMAGLSFYVVVYTVLLKRRTWANIVIGGAAGAFPPLVGWAAVTGDLSPLAWCLFAIIFLWTPVHFWALAIMIKEDYARAGVPMLPVVRGVRATVAQIACYTAMTVAISTAPAVLQSPSGGAVVGRFYLLVAVLLNAVLIRLSLQLYRCPERPQARSLFKYSMVYLALLFLAMAIDRAYWGNTRPPRPEQRAAPVAALPARDQIVLNPNVTVVDRPPTWRRAELPLPDAWGPRSVAVPRSSPSYGRAR